MNRFSKLTVLFAVVLSVTTLASESFAKGTAKASPNASSRARFNSFTKGATKAKPSSTPRHRINQYGNGLPNPDADSNGAESGIGTNYPAPVTFGTGTGHGGPVRGGGNGNPVKPHPIKVLGLQPVQFPASSAVAN